MAGTLFAIIRSSTRKTANFHNLHHQDPPIYYPLLNHQLRSSRLSTYPHILTQKS